MENCDVQIHLRDHDYWRQRRISLRQAACAEKPGDCSKCPCCRDDQAVNLTQKPQCSATTAQRPCKRKRSSVPRPSSSSSEQPGEARLVLWPKSAIPPVDLPQVFNVPTSTQPPSTDTNLNSTGGNDDPLKIHSFSVEEFQHIYHEVVDGMLRFKSGRIRPYSLELGRQIKQKLWERLDRPMMTSQSDDENGLVHVDVTYGVGVYPPLYDVDTTKEPSPGRPPAKRAKSSK